MRNNTRSRRDVGPEAGAEAQPDGASARGGPSWERVFGFYLALWDACRAIASGALEQSLGRELPDLRLDLLGVRVLLALNAGEQRITDLAATLVAAVPNVSRAVRDLEEQALVERALSPTRRGAVNIRHTERGRSVADRLWRRMFEEISKQVEGWSEAELAEGERLLSRLRPGAAARSRRLSGGANDGE